MRGALIRDDLQKQDVLRLAGPNGVLGNRQMCSPSWQMLFFKKTSEDRILEGENLVASSLL